MKILQVCNHFYPCVGGIETYVEDLCKNLIKLGHESDVVCLNTCAYDRKLPEFEKYGEIKIFRIPYFNLKIYKVAPTVFKFLKGYDVVHVHGLGFFSDFLALTKFLHKKPVILSTHGGIFHTGYFLRLKKIYFYTWCRFILRKVDRVIAVSKNDEEIFSKITPVVFIPNAINVGEFKTEVKREPESNSFIYVGRISKNKRIDNLINAAYHLKKRIPDIKLYIVGGDWEGIKKDLEKLVKEKKIEENIVFVGEVKSKKELLNYFSRAKFFLSASEYEGFGISVLEAMASGLVVILNNINAFRSLVENEKNGFLIDYSDAGKASSKILEIINKDLSGISESAKITALRYDWKNIIKKIEEIYKYHSLTL